MKDESAWMRFCFSFILHPSSFILHPFKTAGDMKKLSKIFALYALASAMLVAPFSSIALAQKLVTPPPPMAKKIPKTTNIHGETLIDNYFWLREKNNPEVMAYLEAENAYTKAAMKPTESLQA